MQDTLKNDILRITLNAFSSKPISMEKVNNVLGSDTYLITLNTKQVILKIIDPLHKDLLLGNYNNLIDEVASLKKLNRRVFSPFPNVILYDNSKKLIESEYYFTDYSDGQRFYKYSKDFSNEEISQCYSQMGVFLNKVNQITGTSFGSIQNENYRFSNWYDTIYRLVEAISNRAKQFKVVLPYKYEYIIKRMQKNRLLLNSVEIPSLVYINFNENNFLVDTDLREISGVIGFGIPIYADRVVQAVCSSLEENANFLDCYNHGKIFTLEEKQRMAIYQILASLVYVLMGKINPAEFNEFKTRASKKLEKGLSNYFKYFGENF